MTTQVIGSRTKRGIDLVVSVLLLPVLGFVYLFIAPAVLLSMGRPVFFRQVRPGKDEMPFILLKFRSMRNDVTNNACELSDADRITRVGRLIRSTSIDELPQILNVLRGDMSFIGPRPLLPEYSSYYFDAERLRFSVRPGVTGLAQVSGRNLVGWNERLHMDAAYVTDWSLWLDARIAWRTVTVVLGRNGYQVDQIAVPQRLDVERALKDTGDARDDGNAF